MIDRYNEVGIPTSPLEQTAEDTAKPAEDCIYPSCERCDKYHGSWCTVPMVVSKQNFLLTADLLRRLDARLTEIETLVTDGILGLKPKPIAQDPINYTWADYFEENK